MDEARRLAPLPDDDPQDATPTLSNPSAAGSASKQEQAAGPPAKTEAGSQNGSGDAFITATDAPSGPKKAVAVTPVPAQQQLSAAQLRDLIHEEPDNPSVLSDEKHDSLQDEAAIRAEHQAAARATMIDLAKTLDDLHRENAELRALLGGERGKVKMLREECKRIQHAHDALEEAEENRQAEALVKKALEKNNGVFFSMLLEKSREGYDSSIFGQDSAPKATHRATIAAGESAERLAAELHSSSPTAAERRSSAPDATMPGKVMIDEAEAKRRGLMFEAAPKVPGKLLVTAEVAKSRGLAFEEDPSAPSGKVVVLEAEAKEKAIAGDPVSAAPGKVVIEASVAKAKGITAVEAVPTDGLWMAVGDKVTFGWAFRLWRHEAEKTQKRLAAEAAEAEQRRLEEERQRQIQEEIERRVNQVQAIADELERRLQAEKDRCAQLEKDKRHWEEQMAAEKSRFAQQERAFLLKQEQLQAELSRTQHQLAEKDSQVISMRTELTKVTEQFTQYRQESEDEQHRLKDHIRKLTGDLDQATILARHMRETALKARRDAAQSVSPEKFSQLVAQLEALKDRMTALSKDYVFQQETSLGLQKKLDKKQRTLELERQFLPLLHKARGPLGPVNPQKAGASQLLAGVPPGAVTPKKRAADTWDVGDSAANDGGSPGGRSMLKSQSLSAIDGARGPAVRGGPLGGGY